MSFLTRGDIAPHGRLHPVQRDVAQDCGNYHTGSGGPSQRANERIREGTR